MKYLEGFQYALENIIAINIRIIIVAGLIAAVEFIFKIEILIRKLFVPVEEHLVEAGPRTLSFIYFIVCFFYLINDAYLKDNAPENFYYIQWWILITPISIGVKALAKKVQWRPDKNR